MTGQDDIAKVSLDSPTVLILGAGASRPYGFPLGSELKDQMIKSCSRPKARKVLLSAGFKDEIIGEIILALEGTYHPTIDIFLEKKTAFRSLGAHLIAYTLLAKERHRYLFPQKDWYANLYRLLDFESDTPDTGNLAIVTLNYERSLEHFLRKNIDFNCPDALLEVANDKLSRIEIVHAHGSFGPYPDVAYGQEPNAQGVVSAAAERIKIVSDRLDDSDAFRRARALIRDAANVVFLGFGYEPRTLALLFEDADPGTKTVLGTSYQLDKELEKSLTEFFSGRIKLGGKAVLCNAFFTAAFG